MIDVNTEKLIRLSDVPKLPWLPDRPGGQLLSVQSVYMWSTRGIRGAKLETLAMGGTRCTTQAALLRFFERLSLLATDEKAPTAAELRRADERARKVLAAAGV